LRGELAFFVPQAAAALALTAPTEFAMAANWWQSRSALNFFGLFAARGGAELFEQAIGS
jgi:hypothetical protein